MLQKNFFAGHKIQKLPSRSLSLRNLDPRKKIEKLREKHIADSDTLPEDDDEDFSHVSMKRNGPLYVSFL